MAKKASPKSKAARLERTGLIWLLALALVVGVAMYYGGYNHRHNLPPTPTPTASPTPAPGPTPTPSPATVGQ